MLSPHMLKSTEWARRKTLTPETKKTSKDDSFKRHRSGSVMVFVEEVKDDEDPIRDSPPDYDEKEDAANLLRVRSPPVRGPSPSPGGLTRSQSISPRAMSLTNQTLRDGMNESAKLAKEAKLQRRKTSTAVSLMKKLKIQKSSPPSERECKVEVHHYSNDPTIAWEMLKVKQTVKVVKPMSLDAPIKDDYVRFVCMADTRGAQLNEVFVPDGDVLIVAGSFTHSGHPSEVKAFDRYLGSLPHKYKVVIAGNHELTFDNTWQPTTSVFGGIEKFFKGPVDDRAAFVRGVLQTALAQEQVSHPRQLLTNCEYLEDDTMVIYGLNIHGSPWIPLYDNLAFNLPRGQKLLDKWNLIPSGVDVLITQTPPLGYGDLCGDGHRAGCVELLNSIRRRIHPKYHVFGHIIESYGCTTDGYTKFINASSVDQQGRAVNPPVLFDIALPSGHVKD